MKDSNDVGTFQGDFEAGFSGALAALRKKAAVRMEKGCSRLAQPAMERMAAADAAGWAARAGESALEWARPESAGWRRRLKASHEDAGRCSAATVRTFLHLLGFVRGTLRNRDREFEALITRDEQALESRSPIFTLGTSTCADSGRRHDHGVLELDWDTGCPACRYEAGWIQAQMELSMECLSSGALPDESELLNVLIALADGAIPFPLAPPMVTGWKGRFLDFHLDELHSSLGAQDRACRNLISAYVEFKLFRDTETLLR